VADFCILTWSVPDLIDWSNSAGKTALHMACQSGNTELVRVSITIEIANAIRFRADIDHWPIADAM
jgi:hypothetical protein